MMKKSIIITSMVAGVCVSAYPVCPTKAYKSGYNLAEKNFEKMWDNDCKQLEHIYNNILSKSPVLKCQKRGYYDGADTIYEKYSVECFPTCVGTGENIGKYIGKQFCSNMTSLPPQNITICNVAEENTCMDTFFDYVFENCYAKLDENLAIFDEYVAKYCNKLSN